MRLYVHWKYEMKYFTSTTEVWNEMESVVQAATKIKSAMKVINEMKLVIEIVNEIKSSMDVCEQGMK